MVCHIGVWLGTKVVISALRMLALYMYFNGTGIWGGETIWLPGYRNIYQNPPNSELNAKISNDHQKIRMAGISETLHLRLKRLKCLFFGGNFVVFCVFLCCCLVSKCFKKMDWGWVGGAWPVRIFLGFFYFFRLDKTPYRTSLLSLRYMSPGGSPIIHQVSVTLTIWRH